MSTAMVFAVLLGWRCCLYQYFIKNSSPLKSKGGTQTLIKRTDMGNNIKPSLDSLFAT